MAGTRGTLAGLYYETLFWNDDETPPIVLLPGLLSDGRQVRRLLRELGRKSMVLDPLGAGKSDAPRDAAEYLLPAVVPRLFALLDGLGVKRVDVVGLSMGGMWAQEALAADAQRFRSAILVGTCARISPRLRSLLFGLRALWHHEVPRLDAWRILQAMLFSPDFLERPSTIPLLELLGGEAQIDRSAALGQLDALLRFNEDDATTAKLKPLAQQKIIRAVIGAEHDMLMPISAQRELSQIFGDVPLHVLAGAGHASWLEQPRALSCVLREALDG